MKKASISLAVLVSILPSLSASAFSFDSYSQIVAAAQQVDKKLVKVMNPTEEINFHSVKQLPYRANRLQSIYSKYGRSIPSKVKMVLSKKGYDQTQFVLREGGFGKLLVNNLPSTYEALYEAADQEVELEIKLALTSYLTHVTVQAYQPISKVVFFDHRQFSRGDGGGLKYCIYKGKNNMPDCQYNIRQYWFTYLDGYSPEVNILPPLPIDTVVENAANLAPNAYSVRVYAVPSLAYRENTWNILSEQANLAASHILHIWRDLYSTD
ncbi:hypothetical protein [Vibrio sp. 10N.239.312.D08]|uniref:hypothetical protein n=1 Tax=Vibrio sp. 10N.239.312.D08 TaxID=3229978 RepID=UPI00354B291E